MQSRWSVELLKFRLRYLALRGYSDRMASCNPGCGACCLTLRWSGRVKDEVPSSHNDARAAQLHRWRARDVSARADAGAIEDNGHPIPRLDTLDVHVATNKG